jgi:endoglycosylceramidase
MKKETLIICYLFFICVNSFRINKEQNSFVDNEGRTLVLHGVNVVYKLPPFIPITDTFDPLWSLSQEDMVYLKQFGFNLVRLGVTWESVERSEGQYDMDHLEKMEKIINMLGENGISVILDAHQDMFTRLFCGEGVPPFYARKLFYEKTCDDTYLSIMYKTFGACLPLSTFKWRYDDEGLPFIDDCKHFLKFHQSPELTTIYNSFYNNEGGVQDKFIDFWKVMVTQFKDNPYIIGYDLWNEPWPGNLWSDLYGLWPGWATDNQIMPFYKKVDKVLRELKDDFINMFEIAPFPDTIPFFGGRVLGVVKDTPATDEQSKDKQVYNQHSYCCAAKEDMCDHGEPQVKDTGFCNEFHGRKIRAHLRNAQDLGVPLIFTEFGACSDSEGCYEEMKNFVEHAEESFISWAYWMYKPYGDHTTSAREETEGMFYRDGSIQDVKQKALTRTYIQKYQGTPISNKFNPDSGAYIATFLYNNEIKAPTVLYYNKNYFYKTGYAFRLFDDQNKDIKFNLLNESSENYLHFTISDPKYVFGDGARIVNVSFLQPTKIDAISNSEVECVNHDTNNSTLEVISLIEGRINVEITLQHSHYTIVYPNQPISLGNEFINKISVNINNEKIANIENIYLNSIKVNLS